MLPALEIGSVIDIHRTTVALGPHQHDPASGGRLQGRSCDRKRVQRVLSAARQCHAWALSWHQSLA